MPRRAWWPQRPTPCSKPGEAMLGCRWSKACLPAPVSRALALMGQRLPWRRTSLSAAGNEHMAVSSAVPAAAAPAALPRVTKDGTLPHFVPDRREALLDNLAQLGQPVLPSVATRLWGCVVIDGRACSSCRMCATFCPTGAIRKFDNDDGTLGVYHYPGECVKCGSCRDVCPENAIELLDEVRPAYLLGRRGASLCHDAATGRVGHRPTDGGHHAPSHARIRHFREVSAPSPSSLGSAVPKPRLPEPPPSPVGGAVSLRSDRADGRAAE